MAEATGRYVWVKDSNTGKEKVQWVSDKVLYSYSQLEKSGITSSPFNLTEQQQKEVTKNVSDEVKKSVAKDIKEETQKREQIQNLSGVGAGASSSVALSPGASAANTIKGSGQVYFLFSPVAETQFENIKKAGLEKNFSTLFENAKNIYSRDKKEDSIVYVDWDFESGMFRIERETLSGYKLPSSASGGVSSLSKDELSQLSSQGINKEDIKSVTKTITIEQPKTAGFGSYDVGVTPKFVQKAEIEYQPKNQTEQRPTLIKPLFFDEERNFLSQNLTQDENFSYSVFSPSGLPRKEKIVEIKTIETAPSDVIDYLSYGYEKMLASNKSVFFGERPKDEIKGFLWDVAVYGGEKPFVFTPVLAVSALYQSTKELGEGIGIKLNLGNRQYVANMTETERKTSVEALKDVGIKHLWQGLEIPISIVAFEKIRTASAVFSAPVFRAVSNKLPFEISSSQFFSPKVVYPTLIATQTYAETGDVKKSVASGIGGFAVIRAFELIPDAVIKYKQTFNKYDTARGLGEVTERIFVQSRLHSTPEEALNFMRTASAKEIKNAFEAGGDYGDYLLRTIPKYETITIQKGGRFEIPEYPPGAVAIGFEPKTNEWKAWVPNKARDVGFSLSRDLTPEQKTEFKQLMTRPEKPTMIEYFGEKVSSFRERVLELPGKWIDYVFFTDIKTGLPKTISFSSSVSAPKTSTPKTSFEIVEESKFSSSVLSSERANIAPELKTPKLEISERLTLPVEEKSFQKQTSISQRLKQPQKTEIVSLQKTELIVPLRQTLKQSEKTKTKETIRQIQKTELTPSLRQELKQSQKIELITSLRTELKNSLRTELKTERKTELKTTPKTLTKTLTKSEIKTEQKPTATPVFSKEQFKILEIDKGKRIKTKASGNLLDSLTAYLKSFSTKNSRNNFL